MHRKLVTKEEEEEEEQSWKGGQRREEKLSLCPLEEPRVSCWCVIAAVFLLGGKRYIWEGGLGKHIRRKGGRGRGRGLKRHLDDGGNFLNWEF